VKIAKLQLNGDDDRVAAGSALTICRSRCDRVLPASSSITLTGPADEIVIDARHL
jgi:hypothetical protein